MFAIERDQLMAWLDGILLERNAAGEVLAVDEQACIKAEQLMDEKKSFYLTRTGEICSVACFNEDKNCTEEIPYDDWIKQQGEKISQ